MSVPAPPVAIAPGGCSAVFNNVFYSFTEQAFQSLPLQANAKWEQLEMGVAVNGSRCVVGTQGNQDVLYIVGGQANSSQSSYQGLQRWGFTDQKWETISFGSGSPSVLQDRMNHGAAFLNDSASILVYSGFQGSSGGDSSQTFTIDTNSPRAVAEAFISNQAPPGLAPMLLPWNSSHALMAGGSASNNQIWTFGLQEGWHQVPVLLPTSLGDMSSVQASLVQGSNGSKILELFDLSKSPNTVTGLLVYAGDGDDSPAPNKREIHSHQQVDPIDQPPYNSTFAPKTTRKGYTLAQGANGLVVMAGGTTGKADSVAIFNQTGNNWMDASTLFSPGSAAATSAPTSVPAAPTSMPSQSTSSEDTRMILGIVLGSIFGAIALTGLLFLLCIYTRRRHLEKERGGQHNNKPSIAAPMQATGIDPNAGVFANSPSPARRYFSQRNVDSPVDRSQSPEHQLRVPPAGAVGAQRGPGGRSDQGWSQYFDGRTSEHESAYNGHDVSDTARLTGYTESSEYTSGHESAVVAPLHLRDGQRPPSRETFLDNGSTSHTGEESWDPIRSSDGRGSYGARPPSSVYGDNSVRGPHPGDRVVIPNFPNVPASRTASIVQPSGESNRGMHRVISNDLTAISESSGLRSNPPSYIPPPRGSSKVDDMSWLNLRQ